MGGGGGGGGAATVAGAARELDQTPTWAVASVCVVIILISIFLEKILHHIGQFFAKRKKPALYEALEKVKAELMILGFISLLLTFGQKYISSICIPEKAADSMLPCRLRSETVETETGKEHHERRLLNYIGSSQRRFLSDSGIGSPCHEGKVSLVSTNGLHQLHIFIFFLAVFHVIFSVITMVLGRAKIRGWKVWETEAASQESNDPSKFRFTHETSFVRQHTSALNKNPAIFYIVSFFRQFFRSVRKADYQAMRHGFISVHLAPGSKFDFQKYIKRSMEDDFKVVVGISPALWGSAVIFLLLNVKGWQTMFWVSLMPLVIILSVGTKLQAIITAMAIEIKERHVVVQGMPLVQLTDSHFWFGSPALVLFLIHLTLFQNAFQIIYLLWIWYEFGLNSCFHSNHSLIIVRVFLGVGVEILCAYVTLPLYALVSQMGSHMKQSIFDEQTSKALMNWRKNVKKKQGGGGGGAGGGGVIGIPGKPTGPTSPEGSPPASPGHGVVLGAPGHSRQEMGGVAVTTDVPHGSAPEPFIRVSDLERGGQQQQQQQHNPSNPTSLNLL